MRVPVELWTDREVVHFGMGRGGVGEAVCRCQPLI